MGHLLAVVPDLGPARVGGQQQVVVARPPDVQDGGGGPDGLDGAVEGKLKLLEPRAGVAPRVAADDGDPDEMVPDVLLLDPLAVAAVWAEVEMSGRKKRWLLNYNSCLQN